MFEQDPKNFYKKVTEALTEAMGLKELAKYALDVMRSEGWDKNEKQTLGMHPLVLRGIVDRVRKEFIKEVSDYLSTKGVTVIK
jgi:hypothetical protein